MNKPIKLVISDLDGTLLNGDHQLSEETLRTVQALFHSGIDFWIATGRHHCDAAVIRKKLGIPARLITANGATVSDPQGNLIDQAFLKQDVVRDILQLPIPSGVYQNLYQGEHWLMETLDKVFADYYTDADFKFTLCQFEDYLHLPINKIFFTALSHELLIPVAAAIEEQFGNDVDVTFSMPVCLEVMPKGTNKGSAILALLEKLSIGTEEVMAYGDGMNDLEMLGVVGKGHILENANPLLKAALPQCEIIGHHHDDAVATSLKAHFNI